MNAHFEQSHVKLDQANFLRIADEPGATITCVDGCLWITRNGCAKDIVLAAGESYRVPDATPHTVNAFGPSQAILLRAAPRCQERAPRRYKQAVVEWAGRPLKWLALAP